MEKIKDFFHDYSDIFLAIIISSVMFTVLSFNLGTWFTDSPNAVAASEQNTADSNNTIGDNSDSNFENEDLEDTENVKDPSEEDINNEEKINKDIEDTENENMKDEDNETEESRNNEKENNTSTTPEIKTISIPNGTPGSGIAKILKENGLIDNTSDFIKTAESLNLSNRLKSGSFDISTDASLEDIIRIISGQNI